MLSYQIIEYDYSDAFYYHLIADIENDFEFNLRYNLPFVWENVRNDRGNKLVKTEDIIKIANYFTIVHHINGRLRVRVNPKITNESNSISLKDIEDLPSKINGIKNIKINKIVASVTIMYDPEIFAPSVWEDLIEGKNLEEITVLINKLAKEVA